MHTHTIIDPDDQLADDDRFGKGRSLKNGGYAYDLPLNEDDAKQLPDGIKYYKRTDEDGHKIYKNMTDVVESNNYELKTPSFEP